MTFLPKSTLLAAAILGVSLAGSAQAQLPDAASMKQANEPAWWKEATVYQVYPRSFKDSNGDGIGDIKGIIEKLDYLKRLGINVIWLSPHYASPNVDNGYDISDYRKVMPEFGSMADFDKLMAEMKKRHMRLILDLVANHTSDQHEWFKQSRLSKDNPYRNFYIWRDGKNGGPPNNYTSFFGGNAWQKDPRTGQYYLHLFARQQPDLNWDNPDVRDHVYDIMRFWLDKGVSGFRMDVITYISKHKGLPDLPPNTSDPSLFYASGPHLDDYIQEMNNRVLSHYDTMTVGEAAGVNKEQTERLIGADRGELNMVFHFDLVRLNRDNWRQHPWTLPELKTTYENIYQDDISGWSASILGNHDSPRAVSHFGNASPKWRNLSAKAIATMQFTQRGTPYIYQGEELGMTNYPFEKLEDYNDIEVKGNWPDYVESGKVSADTYLENVAVTSRDNARTMMQWDDSKNAGFSTGSPWFHVNPNYRSINAADEEKDKQSVYNYYRQLIALRAKTPALIYGDFTVLDKENPDLFTYIRKQGDKSYLVAINFTEKTVDWHLPGNDNIKQTLLSNRPESTTNDKGDEITLKPWQSVIYRL